MPLQFQSGLSLTGSLKMWKLSGGAAVAVHTGRLLTQLNTPLRWQAPLPSLHGEPISAGSHFIIYRAIEDGIGIIRVLHQRMDISRHL